jgi:hypothetical protein
MPFDLATAKPVGAGFDLSTAQPVERGTSPQQPAPDPTEGMSNWQKILAGAGKSVADTGRGLQQIGAQAGNAVGLVSDDTVAGIQSNIDESRRLDAPLMQTGAGIAGNIAGSLATTMLPAGAAAKLGQAGKIGTAARAFINPQTYKAAAAGGALLGALQPTATGESRTLNAAIGAAGGTAGQAVANTVGRIVKPIQTITDPARRRAVQTLEAAGVPLDAAQKTGSRQVEIVKRSLGDNPVTQGAQQSAQQAQKTTFNSAVLKQAFGVTADSADETTMASVRDNASKMFESSLNGVEVNLGSLARTKEAVKAEMDAVSKAAQRLPEDLPLDDPRFIEFGKKYAALKTELSSPQAENPFLNRLNSIAARSKRVLGTDNPIVNTVEQLKAEAAANGGKLDGKLYHVFRQDLGALQSQPNVSPVASDMLNALDDAFEASAGADKKQMFREARRLWRNMKIVEGAIATDGSGEISASKLANAFGTKKNRTVGVYGKGDKSIVELSKLAKAGKALIPDKFPNSGTASRLAAQAVLPAAIGGAAYEAQQGDLPGMAKWAIGGVAAPILLQRGLNNPAVVNYLSKGLQGQNLLNYRGLAALPAAASVNALQQK